MLLTAGSASEHSILNRGSRPTEVTPTQTRTAGPKLPWNVAGAARRNGCIRASGISHSDISATIRVEDRGYLKTNGGNRTPDTTESRSSAIPAVERRICGRVRLKNTNITSAHGAARMRGDRICSRERVTPRGPVGGKDTTAPSGFDSAKRSSNEMVTPAGSAERPPTNSVCLSPFIILNGRTDTKISTTRIGWITASNSVQHAT